MENEVQLVLPIRVPMIIGGDERGSSHSRQFQRENPANTEQIVSVAESASLSDVDAAIAAAREAFDSDKAGWVSNAKLRERVLYRTADLLRQDASKLATLLAFEVGMPIRQAQAHITAAADIIEFYAGYATKLYGHALVLANGSVINLLKEPIGVIAAITPWNFPLTQAARKLAPALAVGCTAVVKPASYSPAVTYYLIKYFREAGLPPGVVNFVPGPGAVIGDAMIKDRRISKVSFTGETETGKSILKTAANDLKRVSLELGGKNPFILFADAPLEAAAKSLVFGAFRNTGQACGATSRLLVQESVREAFLSEVVRVTCSLAVGPPLDVATDVGPMISHSQMDKVAQYIKEGAAAGFPLVVGGQHLRDGIYSDGYFVEPTIFDQVDPSSPLAQEEVFGPVLAVIPFRTEDKAIELANDVPFGLTASVWCRETAQALRVARRLHAGTVWLNDAYTQPPEGIWGGYKESGIGRELGPYGIEDFVEIKQVYMDGTGIALKPHYRQLIKD